MSKIQICTTCSGCGGEDYSGYEASNHGKGMIQWNAVRKCTTCEGSGLVLRTVTVAPYKPKERE